jgi:hypothetical protein
MPAIPLFLSRKIQIDDNANQENNQNKKNEKKLNN